VNKYRLMRQEEIAVRDDGKEFAVVVPLIQSITNWFRFEDKRRNRNVETYSSLATTLIWVSRRKPHKREIFELRKTKPNSYAIYHNSPNNL